MPPMSCTSKGRRPSTREEASRTTYETGTQHSSEQVSKPFLVWQTPQSLLPHDMQHVRCCLMALGTGKENMGNVLQ
jgi:hypothetical protein